MKNLFRNSALGAVSAMLAFAGAAHATSLTITVENFQGTSAEGNGLSLTPFWVSFLDTSGTFDAFDAGSAASAEVEAIAEVGTVGGLDAAAAAAQADAVTGVVVAPGGVAGTIDPGETGTLVIDVDPFANDWFQFLSMIVPTNDTFVGLDRPVDLFDDAGNFFGTQTFDLTLINTYDAGTEDNIFLNGAAFLAGVDGGAGQATQGGVIGSAQPTDFSAELLADGATLLDPLLAQAFFDGQTALGRVTISLTPDAAVPVPGAALLFGTMLAGGAVARRKKQRA